LLIAAVLKLREVRAWKLGDLFIKKIKKKGKRPLGKASGKSGRSKRFHFELCHDVKIPTTERVDTPVFYLICSFQVLLLHTFQNLSNVF
jgi:hypothetical protein